MWLSDAVICTVFYQLKPWRQLYRLAHSYGRSRAFPGIPRQYRPRICLVIQPLSSVWISIEWSVMVLLMCLWDLSSVIGHVQFSLLVIGGGGIDKNCPFNHLSDFAKNWLEGVYMYRDDTCEIIFQSDHPFKRNDQKFKCSIYVLWLDEAHQVLCENLSSLWHETDCAIHCATAHV